ncbi:uncharacterized protein Gasu_12540 [Galdieria sulphuraria]|uniref:Uncharacterized protein n=1 Tax=Galdieria sulphuraria TaxID=130081 RepID=M2Y6C3_GALSU|nr:uncharacterized protein Gasu_12540 [Galdieria sulphuraria]EME31583.1 hypothetical protein Gasu_12540 [Galdieria sulphuraria]|eukprot:XP_005708103.1 hypothetical protein Gasu_12540 [Galdieria sulphuraria]
MKRHRQCSLRVQCKAFSTLEPLSISSRWLQKSRNLVTLLLIGSFFPSPLVNVGSATTLSSANFSNVDPYGNHLSFLETAQWFQSVAQVEPALLNFDETLALSTDSETFSLYPCLNLGRSTCNDSLISNSNYSSKYANTKEIIVGDKSKGKFPWSAWFKVEDTTAVNKEETKVEKKGRYVFVIVTLLVIACVVPMIQYFSYTRDK